MGEKIAPPNRCTGCGVDIDEKVKRCPHCGADKDGHIDVGSTRLSWLIVCMLALLLGALVMLARRG